MDEATANATVRAGVDGFFDDLVKQQALVGDRNRPYARALAAIAEIVDPQTGVREVIDRLDRAWQARRFTSFYERPLLLLAALRAEALAGSSRHPLARGFASESPDADQVTRAALMQAMSADKLGLWLALGTRRVQTNEVSRAVVWRWPAHLAGCSDGARPLMLVDIGASGGLNLIADRLPSPWTDLHGAALPTVTRPRIEARLGFDNSPLDLKREEDVAWARACLWPGEAHRLESFDQAVAALRSMAASSDAVVVERLNATLAPSRLSRLVRAVQGRALVFAYQTFVRDYLEPAMRDRYREGMLEWVLSSPQAVWLEMELAAEGGIYPATLTAHLADDRGGVRTLCIARCGYHPTVIEVLPDHARFAAGLR
jgi:hypothetical protein